MEEQVARRVDLSGDRIVTKSLISNIIRNGSTIRIVRSGVYGVLTHCGDVIREACEQADHTKEIQIILPSLTNADVVHRAQSAGRSGEEVLNRLADWNEVFAQLSQDLAPKHRLEIRTTEFAHRYHAYFSESEGIVGIAWHHKASLTTTSFDIGPDADCRKWVIGNLIDDFEWHWDQCQPYNKGDNKKRKAMGVAQSAMNPILAEFGKGLPNIMAALRFIAQAFPDANGNGATKEHLAARFGSDANDWNKRMLEMERAGLLYKLGCGGTARDHFGRVPTKFGQQVRRQWDQAHGSHETGR